MIQIANTKFVGVYDVKEEGKQQIRVSIEKRSWCFVCNRDIYEVDTMEEALEAYYRDCFREDEEDDRPYDEDGEWLDEDYYRG